MLPDFSFHCFPEDDSTCSACAFSSAALVCSPDSAPFRVRLRDLKRHVFFTAGLSSMVFSHNDTRYGKAQAMSAGL